MSSRANVTPRHNRPDCTLEYLIHCSYSSEQFKSLNCRGLQSHKTHKTTYNCFKGVVDPKKKILSSFTQGVPNLYEFLSSVKYKVYILKNVGN